MNRRPSAAVIWAPAACLMKIGSPPTPRNARTGEFTPPGMYLQASSNRLTFAPGRGSSSRQRRDRQAQADLEAACREIAGLGRASVGLHHLSGNGEADAL